jgi:hypothetical protein
MKRESDASLKFRRGLAIVPAFNEAGTIGAVVDDLRRTVPDLDVLVVDDGSTDGTAAAVPPEAAVISLPFNLGIGGAMQTGYRYAAAQGYDVAVQVDGDGQHPAGEVPGLLRALEDERADLVIGSRFLRPGSYRQTASRAAGAGVLRAIIRCLTSRTFTDCTSGFRAANRRVIEAFSRYYPDDYPEPEVVVQLHRAGFRVVETPVTMEQRSAGRSSIGLLRGVYYVIKVALALVLDTLRNPWAREARTA